ncbi:hypothetical protein Taro_049725 [Colocasia esculenta]|uniref:CCHC-type domain-containing protein n=1 Tax=Colocasia esculenta TaxID=4460 RepID=A0A843XBU0_COLES|nr:hypothetical protein [Colocasia esculenta]
MAAQGYAEDSDKSNGSSEDEEAFLSRRLQRILAKKKYQSGRRYFKKGKYFKKPEVKDAKKSELVCYECKKPGHIKAECLKLKKREFKKKDNSKKFRRYKKKAMAATWSNESDSDSESSSSDGEEEKANLAFMANVEYKKQPPYKTLAKNLKRKVSLLLCFSTPSRTKKNHLLNKVEAGSSVIQASPSTDTYQDDV